MIETFPVISSCCTCYGSIHVDQFATSITLLLPISVKLNLNLIKLCLDVVLYLLSVLNCSHSFLLQLDNRSFGSASDYDHDSMIKKLSRQREENSQLVNQNHKLMTELENLSFDLHQARNKVLNNLPDLHKESTTSVRTIYSNFNFRCHNKILELPWMLLWFRYNNHLNMRFSNHCNSLC